MQKIELHFENCYGIKKLQYTFNFSQKNTFAIYAPNGIMKSSFAKTFKDASNNNQAQDLIYPERKTIQTIKNSSGNDLESTKIFVIEPYDSEFNSDKLSTLIVKKELKQQYDKLHNDIQLKRVKLISALTKISGIKYAESEIINLFEEENIYLLLNKLKSQIQKKSSDYSEVPYEIVFHSKVKLFLETADFKLKLKEYIEKFNELINNSNYFQKGIFNHNNASTITKSLNDQGFFKAKHSINLNAKDSKELRVDSETQLNKLIQDEKIKILSDTELSKKFEIIDKAITKNTDLRNFRNYLENNPEIILKLIDLNSFNKELWIYYFNEEKELILDLLNTYQTAKKELEEIVKAAQKEKTEWEKVTTIFNKRFHVPFKVIIINKEDVILNDQVPSLGFIFNDGNGDVETDRETLLNVLSQGERRALYILNIIFEIEVRKKINQETLLIIDDIADSFDYKNKYAIIEYLRDISNNNLFYEIILTHNFDFFRTLESRFVPYRSCLMVKKTDEAIELCQASNIKNPFNNDWKNNLNTDNKKLIASIPFVRNLIEYTKGNDNSNFIKLTSILHLKQDSNSITISDIETIFKTELHQPSLILNDRTKNVIELILETAEECSLSDEYPNLENKIVLSIAIRLIAEKFMIEKINNSEQVNSITKNQTFELFCIYSTQFPTETEYIDLLDQVNLMTPENIHLNSFMYEPILDLSINHLVQLYDEIKLKLQITQ